MQLSDIVKKKISELVVDNYPTAHISLVTEGDRFSLRSRDGKIVGIEVEDNPENADIVLNSFRDIAGFIRNEELKNVGNIFGDMEKELRLENYTPENWACKNNIELFLDQLIKKFDVKLGSAWKTLTSYHNACPTDSRVLELRQEHADLLTCVEYLKLGTTVLPRQSSKTRTTFNLFRSVTKRYSELSERVHEVSSTVQSFCWLAHMLMVRVNKYRSAKANVFPVTDVKEAAELGEGMLNSIVDPYIDSAVKDKPCMGKATKENVVKWYDNSNVGHLTLTENSRAKLEAMLRILATN
ncbi:MAG: hypothetical protein ACRDBQ_18960 [Shewanella sp.]